MAKWEVSGAAEKRILERISETLKSGGYDLRATQVLADALKPEDFRYPRDIARELVVRWTRERDEAWLRSLCANWINETCFQLKDYRETVRAFSLGLYNVLHLAGFRVPHEDDEEE